MSGSRAHAKSSYGKRRMPGSLIQLETQGIETQLHINPTEGTEGSGPKGRDRKEPCKGTEGRVRDGDEEMEP